METRSKLVAFRNAFISGALLLAPVIVTGWAFTKIVEIVGGTFTPIYEAYLPLPLQKIPFLWDFLATIAVVILITAFGLLSNYVLGKYFFSIGERAIQRIPAVGAVYQSVKQIVATFSSQNRNLFNKVVLIEFPRKGVWSLAFLTNKQQGEPHVLTSKQPWTVFVPTTPNPTSGFLIMVPEEDVVELEMSVGDGMKMIISGGAVVPTWPAPAKADAAAAEAPATLPR